MNALPTYATETLDETRKRLSTLLSLEKRISMLSREKSSNDLAAASCKCVHCAQTYSEASASYDGPLSQKRCEVEEHHAWLHKNVPEIMSRLERLQRLITTETSMGYHVGFISSALGFGCLSVLGITAQRKFLNQGSTRKLFGTIDDRIQTLTAREKRLERYRWRLLNVPRDEWYLQTKIAA